MIESKCILCGKKIISKAPRKFCNDCSKARKRECVRRCYYKKIEREKANPPKPKIDKSKERHDTFALSAKISVATGLSYGQQVLLAQRQKKDLRAFLEGVNL